MADSTATCGCDGESRCSAHSIPVNICNLANFILGREAVTGADFVEARLAMLGGCLHCGASIACYNAYPAKDGYWRCGDCIGDLGYDTVEEAFAGIFPDRVISHAEALALAKHILALETDPYLQGHPEWESFLNEAAALVKKAEG